MNVLTWIRQKGMPAMPGRMAIITRPFASLMLEGGYSDIYLISLDGDVVYSTAKEADFASNLLEGPLAETGLARAYRAATKAQGGEVIYDDFAYYEPSGEPAGFFSTQVIGMGAMIGVIVVQSRPEALAKVSVEGVAAG